MPSLIQNVTNTIPPDMIAKVAGMLGESPADTASGFDAAAPALLAGALQQGSTTSGANDLLGLVRQATAAGKHAISTAYPPSSRPRIRGTTSEASWSCWRCCAAWGWTRAAFNHPHVEGHAISTSRFVPQQVAQIARPRAGHCRLALPPPHIGHDAIPRGWHSGNGSSMR